MFRALETGVARRARCNLRRTKAPVPRHRLTRVIVAPGQDVPRKTPSMRVKEGDNYILVGSREAHRMARPLRPWPLERERRLSGRE